MRTRTDEPTKETGGYWWQDVPPEQRYHIGIKRLERQAYGRGRDDGEALAMGCELQHVKLLTEPEHYDPALRGGLPKADCYRRGLRDGFALQAAAAAIETAEDGVAGPPVTAEAHGVLMEMIGEPRYGPRRDWRKWNAERWAAKWGRAA